MISSIVAVVYNDERFGINDARSSFNYFNCPGGSTMFSQCTPVRKGGSCYISISKCGTERGLRCFSKFITKWFDVYI